MTYRLQNVNSNSSMSSVINQVNSSLGKLDRETVVKQFKGQNGESLSIGKTGDDTIGMKVTEGDVAVMNFGQYRSDRYGLLLYENGVPIVLIGQAPDDGRMGMWQAAPGQNVLTLLGG
jgi:hypothetical protein